VWPLAPEAFGRFAASIPAPRKAGKIRLVEGCDICGFLAEGHAIEGASDHSIRRMAAFCADKFCRKCW
jgi:allophanate hydrolase